jgi:hypothetical protein
VAGQVQMCDWGVDRMCQHKKCVSKLLHQHLMTPVQQVLGMCGKIQIQYNKMECRTRQRARRSWSRSCPTCLATS